MNSQNAAVEDGFTPPPTINDLSIAGFNSSLSAYNTAINSQYFGLEKDSPKIIFNGKLEEQSLTIRLKRKISRTNYDTAALNGESIVLFDKPYLVGGIYCKANGLIGKKNNVIRLITHSYSNKQVIPYSHESSLTLGSSSSNDSDLSAVYIVNEVIWGFILPNYSEFKYATCLDLQELVSDNEKLHEISKAHSNLFLAADSLKRDVVNTKKEAESYLSEQKNIAELVKQELSSTLKEKERIDKSVSNENKTLERIRTDIENETKELDKVIAEKEAYSDRLEEVRYEIVLNKDKITNEKSELDKFKKLVQESRSELFDLQDQIAKAKADINVTTLDMKGFSSESKNQVSKYFWLALAAIAFLAIVFSNMYENAKTFSDLVDENPTVSIWNILASRLPLITATTLIIGTLSALLFYLVNNLISVSEDKMNMLKASILAEQITGSLPKDGMSLEEIRDYKRNTKIELVMNIFANKPDKISEPKQTDNLKQFADIVKSLR